MKTYLRNTQLGQRLIKEWRKFRPHPIKPALNLEQLETVLTSLGVQKDMMLVVHCSLSDLGASLPQAKLVIELLLKMVGKQGTILVPTFTYISANPDRPFDIRYSRSDLGLFSEFFRLHPRAVRSMHPTHSVAAIGKHAEYLVRDHEKLDTPFGIGSPWEKLLEWDTQILVLGMNTDIMSLYHAIEDWGKVPLRYLDNPVQFEVIDPNGEHHQVTSYLHGPNPGRPDSETFMTQQGFLKKALFQGTPLYLVDARRMATAFLNQLQWNPYALFQSPWGTLRTFWRAPQYYFEKSGDKTRFAILMTLQWWDRPLFLLKRRLFRKSEPRVLKPPSALVSAPSRTLDEMAVPEDLQHLPTFTSEEKRNAWENQLIQLLSGDSELFTPYPEYFRLRGLEFRLLRQLLPEYLSISKQYSSALEIGCGYGFNTLLLAPNCQKLLGIDIPEAYEGYVPQAHASSVEMAKILVNDKFLIPEIEFRTMWPTDLKLESESISLIFSEYVFEHIPQLDRAAKEMFRVLEPGGVMIHVVPGVMDAVIQFLRAQLDLSILDLAKLLVKKIIRRPDPRQIRINGTIIPACHSEFIDDYGKQIDVYSLENYLFPLLEAGFRIEKVLSTRHHNHVIVARKPGSGTSFENPGVEP